MFRASRLLGGLLVLVALTAGCEPTLSENELGNVVFEVPQVSQDGQAADSGGVNPAISEESASETDSDQPNGSP